MANLKRARTESLPSNPQSNSVTGYLATKKPHINSPRIKITEFNKKSVLSIVPIYLLWKFTDQVLSKFLQLVSL